MVEPLKKKSNIKKIILGSFLGILIGSVFGVTVAMFSYNSSSINSKLIAGDIYMRYKETSAINLSGAMPSATYPSSETGNYFEFQIIGKNTSSSDITYNVKLAYGDEISGKDRIRDEYLLFKLVEVINNEEQTPIVNDKSFTTIPGATLYTAKILKNTNNETTRTFRVYARISENVGIGTNTTYTTQEWNNLYASVKINVDGTSITPAGEIVKANIKSNNTSSTCQNATLTWTDPEDGITYISGSKDCVDFNYLWYSGKMWRITALYPDGAMKLVTEDAITAIQWGSDIEYDGSYMYQWLNEDFKDTLINSDTILENATWNYSTDGNSTPVRPETIETQKTKQARVGLLNAYEYYNAYRNSSTSANYLNIGYYWWLITPYSGLRVRSVGLDGSLNYSSPSSSTIGARPSVILQSNITLSGSGIKTDPYMIVGNDYASGNVGDNLYDRHSGEYVNFNNEKYRIVSTENNITKLTRNDILRDENTTTTPKTAITKNFASSAYFGKSTNTQSDNYWDYYLNNNESGGWLNGISSNYKNMMVDGTYYLGLYGSNTNYKATICKDSNLNLVTTKNCTRYPTDSNTDGYDANKIYIGKVGLPRVGEMFSAQLGGGYGVSSNMWLITPSSGSGVRNVYDSGALYNISPSSGAGGARPSINLSSEVKITCNSSKCDGTEQYPYDLTM